MAATLLDDLTGEARAFDVDTVALRRAIHREPELGNDNPSTQAKILQALEGLGLEITLGTSVTSVVADLVGGRPGPTFMLRADTDALPMLEESGEPFTSEIEGRAHSCGHDAHVAMLVGAARLLAARRDDIAGTVRFVFQPGEEGCGGARNVIEEGALVARDGGAVAATFAIHVSPNVPTGYVASRPGPLMAATDDFKVTVRGRGAHASTPHFGNDPVPVACEMVQALQTFVTRRLDVFNSAVVTVGRIDAGTTTNVIADKAVMEGTIRTVSDFTRMSVTAGFERIVTNIAAAHECEVDIDLRSGYPVTVNDPGFVEFASGVVEESLGRRYFSCRRQ
ncbi:UNVERIFIED_CONTAM: hypothetical protein GTU68_048320 [Idotea baltica]|nr:hypothetical protein [Idotea baltica]